MPYTAIDPFGVGIIHKLINETVEKTKNVEFTAIVKPKGKLAIRFNAFSNYLPSPKQWLLVKLISYETSEGRYWETYYSAKPFTNNINDLKPYHSGLITNGNEIGNVTLRGNMEVAYTSCYEIQPPQEPTTNTIPSSIPVEDIKGEIGEKPIA